MRKRGHAGSGRFARPLFAGAALLLAAGCAGAATAQSPVVDAKPSGSSTPPATTKPTPANSKPAPLTGLPVTAAVAGQPAVAVAINRAAGPSAGLGDADVVFYVLGDAATASRLVAVYQSRYPAASGPLSDTQPADPKLIGSLHPVYAFAGGRKTWIEALGATPVLPISPALSPGQFVAGPTGMLAEPARLAGLTRPGTPPPATFFRFATAGERLTDHASSPAHSIVVSVPGQPPLTWEYDSAARSWRAPALGAAAQNVVVQVTDFRSVKVDKYAMTTVLSPDVLGRGLVAVASGPQMATGTWFKPALDAGVVYADSQSVPLRLAAGTTWIITVPPGSAVTPS